MPGSAFFWRVFWVSCEEIFTTEKLALWNCSPVFHRARWHGVRSIFSQKLFTRRTPRLCGEISKILFHHGDTRPVELPPGIPRGKRARSSEENFAPRRSPVCRATGRRRARSRSRNIYRKEHSAAKPQPKSRNRFYHEGMVRRCSPQAPDTKVFVGCASRTGRSRNISRKACPERRRRARRRRKLRALLHTKA